jgi:tetratricopeptide (TPR) repeat protein
MSCLYCGGHHDTEYCLGYNSSSLNESVEEVQSAMMTLAEHGQDSLEELSNGFESIRNGFDALKESQSTMVDAVRAEISSTRASLEGGLGQVSGSIMASAAMTMSALAGIGAVMQYRERMDQLRHKDRLQFDEEASDAGRARRELKAAFAFLTCGDPEQAESHVNQSIRLFPSAAESFRIRGIVEHLLGRHDKACTSFRVALKLADDGDLLPNIDNVNDTVDDETHQAVFVSATSQLAQGLAILTKEEQATDLLDKAIERYGAEVDLHIMRIRALSKTPAWSERYRACLSELVHLSPMHFNVVFLDQQLGRHLEQAQIYLKEIRNEAATSFQNKRTALAVVSRGRIVPTTPTISGSTNFPVVVAAVENVSKQLEEAVRTRSLF